MMENHILEITPTDAAEPFLSLYKKSRQHFCARLAKVSEVDFWAILTQKEDMVLGQEIDRIATDVAHTVVPSGDVLKEYIEANGRLIEPHEEQEWLYGKKPEGPLEAAYFNLFFWVYKSLSDFWDQRLAGDFVIIVNVTRSGISVRGVLPRDVAKMFYRPGEGHEIQSALDSIDSYGRALSEQRSAMGSEATSDPPF